MLLMLLSLGNTLRPAPSITLFLKLPQLLWQSHRPTYQFTFKMVARARMHLEIASNHDDTTEPFAVRLR